MSPNLMRLESQSVGEGRTKQKKNSKQEKEKTYGDVEFNVSVIGESGHHGDKEVVESEE